MQALDDLVGGVVTKLKKVGALENTYNFRCTEFSEVRLQLARGFEKGQNKAYGHSIFIGILSGVGINDGLHAHPCVC